MIKRHICYNGFPCWKLHGDCHKGNSGLVGWHGIMSMICIDLYHMGLNRFVMMSLEMKNVMGTLIDFVVN